MSLALALRIQATGTSQATGEVRRFAGSMDAVSTSSTRAKTELKGTADAAQMVGQQARQARAFEQSLDTVGGTANTVSGRMAAMSQRSNAGLREGENRAKAFGKALFHAGKEGAEAWTGMQFSIGGVIGKIKEAENRIDGFRKKVGLAMIAGGVAGAFKLGGDVGVAATKQSRVSAIEGIVSKDAGANAGAVADDIYKKIDEMSVSSVFNLPELVVAGKTFTKDRQFSVRNLRAADDLAAASRDEGATPQDVARALGRLRAGDTGEAFERLRDFGISRPELEAKGLKFDSGGSLEDKSVEGVDRAVTAVVEIIEDRFGGLSEKLATQTLEGATSNLQDAVGRWRTAIGEELIPVINFAARALTKIVTWFTELPRPIKFVIAWGSVFISALGAFGGALLVAWPLISGIMLAVKVLGFVSGVTGISVSKLAWTMVSRLVPGAGAAVGALGSLIPMLTVALPAAVALGMALMIKAWEDKRAEIDNRDAEGTDAEVDKAAWQTDANTKEGAQARADDIKKRREAIQSRDYSNEKPGWLETAAMNLGGAVGLGLRARAYQRTKQIEQRKRGNETEAAALKYEEDKWRKKASVLPSATQASSVAGVKITDGTPTTAITGVFGDAGSAGNASAREASISALETEIYSLQDQLRSASKEEKPVLRERLIAAQRRMKAARRALAADKRSASASDRDAKKREREAEKQEKAGEREAKKQENADERDARKRENAETGYDQLRMKTRGVQVEEDFNTRIAELEARRDAAQEEKDKAREKQLELEIARLQAQRDYATAMTEADATALEDERKADEMRRQAEAKRRGELQRAQIKFNAAGNALARLLAKLRAGGSLYQLSNRNTLTGAPITADAFERSGINGRSGAARGYEDESRALNPRSLEPARPATRAQELQRNLKREMTVNLRDQDFQKTRLPNNDVEITFKGTFTSTDSFLDAVEAIA
jgi:hypothetical protein